MFWNKKSTIEKDREIQLNVIHIRKLIAKAIGNAENTITSFDIWTENKYNSSKKDSTTLSALTGLMDTHRYVSQNKDVLSEFKNAINNRQLKTPAVILDKIKNLQTVNDEVDIKISVFNKTLAEHVKDDSVSFLAYMVSLDKEIRLQLSNLLNDLNDLHELLNLHFSPKSFGYVNLNRLEELYSIKNQDFDLSKLFRLCEELNSNFQNRNYLSVSMLVRAILDHIPPVFGFKTFIEVSSNYGGKSLKKSLQNLQNSSRNISDAYLHETIKSRESLPNETQIDFRNDLDVLLAEIVRILK